MNTAVKLLVGFSVVAGVAGASLARLRLDTQADGGGGARPLVASARSSSAAEPSSAAPVPSGVYGDVTIRRNAVGQFEAAVEIDGQSIPMMVDTGATLVVLSFDDASRLGIRPAPSEFDQWVSTANGRAPVARVTLRQVRLGPIVVRDVAALVASRHALNSSLLGMTFLGQLRSVRVEDGRLALRQ